MARTTDTRALTEQAFWELLATARKPTIQAVQEWLLARGLTRRNNNTIGSALEECWQQLGTRLKQERSAPELPEDVVDQVLNLRRRMLEVASSVFDEDRAKLREEVESIRQQAASSIAEAERGQREFAERLRGSELSAGEARAALAEREARLADLLAELAAVRSDAAAATERAAATAAQVIALEQRAAESDTRYSLELKTAHERYEALQAQMMVDMDRYRTEAAELRQELSADRSQHDGRTDAMTERVVQAENARVAAEARAEGSAAELRKVHGRLVQREMELERLQNEYAQIEGKLDLLAAQLAVAQGRIAELEGRPRGSSPQGNLMPVVTGTGAGKGGGEPRKRNKPKIPNGNLAGAGAGNPNPQAGGAASPAGRKRKPKPAGNPAGPASAGNNAQPAAGNRRRKRGGGGGAGGGNAQPLAAGEAGRDAGRDDDDGDNLGNA